jgi:hypothetical protein
MGMDKTKFYAVVITLCVACIIAAYAVVSLLSPVPQKELDFTVTGKNDCLRFLNSSVQTVYIPFNVAAEQEWQLTINATQMPGGANGWTDVYIYEGYWDNGEKNTCLSSDVYPIISQIDSADAQITGSEAFTRTFSCGPEPQSYTVFFIFPPGGSATFHVTLTQLES